MHSEQAYVLGGSANKGGSAATAAEARSQKNSSPWMPQGPQKLGGDGAVTKWMKPGDAAAAAAVERCLAGEKWRLPCTTVVELLLSSSRSQFLVKDTRGECDNSFFHFFSSKEFQTFFVATSKGGNDENKEDEEAQHGNLDRDMSGYLENDLSI